MVYEKYTKKQLFRKPWCRLTIEEKNEIIEKSNLKKEETQRKENKKKADIIKGKQRTIENSLD